MDHIPSKVTARGRDPDALATEMGKSDLDRDNVDDSGDIVSICAGLLIVDTDHHLRDPVLRLVHYTTQKYLRRTDVIHFPNATETIASSCLTYLLFDIFSGSACRLSPDRYNVQKNRGESAATNLMRTRNPDEVTGFLYFGCKRYSNRENHYLQKPGNFLRYISYSTRKDKCSYFQDELYPFYGYAAWYCGIGDITLGSAAKEQSRP